MEQLPQREATVLGNAHDRIGLGALACALLYAAVLLDVAADGLLVRTLDPAVRDQVGLDAGLTHTLASWLTLLGGYEVLIPLMVVSSVLLAQRGRPRDVLWLLGGTLSGFLFIRVNKILMARPRPDDVGSLNAFPSGHTGNAVIDWTLAVILLWPVIAPEAKRGQALRVGLTTGVMVGVLVAFTRLVLDVHWATDVLAGLFLGVSWALGVVWLRGEVRRRLTRASPNRHAP
jgi:membrane-associated phospholipid phosphatase